MSHLNHAYTQPEYSYLPRGELLLHKSALLLTYAEGSDNEIPKQICFTNTLF